VRLLLKPAKGNVADGHWHRLTVGYDRERHRLFGTLDGKVATPVALAEFPAIPEVIWLGGGRTGFLHGAFDEVQLYRSVLEDAKDEEK
jgi:hypothetical protein